MLQLEVREKELMKYVNKLFITVVITPLYYYSGSFIIHNYQALLDVRMSLFPPSQRHFQSFEISTMTWQVF